MDTVCSPEQGTSARIVDLMAKREKRLRGKYILMHSTRNLVFSISRQRLDSANLKEKVPVRPVLAETSCIETDERRETTIDLRPLKKATTYL